MEQQKHSEPAVVVAPLSHGHYNLNYPVLFMVLPEGITHGIPLDNVSHMTTNQQKLLIEIWLKSGLKLSQTCQTYPEFIMHAQQYSQALTFWQLSKTHA